MTEASGGVSDGELVNWLADAQGMVGVGHIEFNSRILRLIAALRQCRGDLVRLAGAVAQADDCHHTYAPPCQSCYRTVIQALLSIGRPEEAGHED